MAHQLLRRLRDERGGSLVETLLALMLVALVVDVGVEGFAFAQARSVAIAAAQDGARAAASNDDTAGLTRAQQVPQTQAAASPAHWRHRSKRTAARSP